MQWGLDGAVAMLWDRAPFSVGHAVNTGAEAHDLASPASASHTEVTERAGPEKTGCSPGAVRSGAVHFLPPKACSRDGATPLWVLTPGLAGAWIIQLVSSGSGEA